METRKIGMKSARKTALLACLLGALLTACAVGNRQDPSDPVPLSRGEWAWISGPNSADQDGIYGTQGVPSPSNVPGVRRRATSWLDRQGKLWLFGGSGLASAGSPGAYAGGELNDLWTFDPSSLEWTWISGSASFYQAGVYGIKGVPGPSNVPGARFGAASWVDPSGRLWLFGGRNFDAYDHYPPIYFGSFNDLWMFDPATLQWTWISGSDIKDQWGVYGTKGVAAPTNVPGARCLAASWVDPSGRLWLFGGDGMDSAGNPIPLNDLWRFDPESQEWTWIAGCRSNARTFGVYGTKGTPAPTNIPGGRVSSASWLDPQGNFWLFGGSGFDGSGHAGLLNDLWKFDPQRLAWTWVSGSDSIDPQGVYGTRGLSAPANEPSGREAAASWVDPSGGLWIYGGHGYDTAVMTNELYDDLWKYDPMANAWTWIGGSDLPGQYGVYGTQGVSSEKNSPGQREGAVSWFDPSGKFWLFGGHAYGEGLFSDLWRYTREGAANSAAARCDIVRHSVTRRGVVLTRAVLPPNLTPGAGSPSRTETWRRRST